MEAVDENTHWTGEWESPLWTELSEANGPHVEVTLRENIPGV